jgi:hypothetical protein
MSTGAGRRSSWANMSAVSTPAADRVGEAIDAASRVAGRVGADASCFEVLHKSNNVVVRFADIVLKVSTDFAMAERDVIVASHANANSGPALAPLRAPLVDGEFTISVWPYLPDRRDASEDEAGKALRDLHRALVGVPADLPPLNRRFSDVAELLADTRVTSALDSGDRALLQTAIAAVSPAAVGDTVLHTEPHDGNQLTRDGRVVFIDFEATAIGPVEWDLAFLPDDVVHQLWPGHNVQLRTTLMTGVSGCVSAACWRDVTARPDDAEMRWHAEHHLQAVRSALS